MRTDTHRRLALGLPATPPHACRRRRRPRRPLELRVIAWITRRLAFLSLI